MTAGNGNFNNLSAIIAAANPLESAHEQTINDIVALVEEFAANRNAGSGNELEAMLVTNIASRLPSDVASQIANAIFLEVERRDRSGFAEFGAEQWERVKKEAKDERERLDKMADMADDANNGQLSTKPDQYGLSEQNYADLNSELKTRDGQERFMAFLRMMNPNLTDAEIRQRLDIANAITAERSGRGTADTRRTLENASPELVEEVSGNLAQFQQMNGREMTRGVTNQADAQAVTVSAETATETTTVDASMDILSGGNVSGAIAPSRTSLTAQVEGRGEFAATAPPLRANFVAANAARGAPLDQPAPPQVFASAAPVTTAPAVSAGFDV